VTLTIKKGSRQLEAAPSTWLAGILAALDEPTLAKVFDNVEKAVAMPALENGLVGAPVPLSIPSLDLTVRRG
jgi:hypothetical protein